MARDDRAVQSSTAYRWYALAVLTLLFTTHNLDRNVVSVVAEPIKREFHLSDSALGLMIGPVFALSYTLAGIPIGFLIDRVNRVRLISALLSTWSVLTVFSGLAMSFPMLALARVGVAVGESGASPTCMSLLTDIFPHGRRATAFGWFYASTPIGLFLGYAIGGLVAAHFGWRAAFFVGGAPGLVVAALVLSTLREPRRGGLDAPLSIEAAAQARLSPRAVLALMWRSRAVRYLVLASSVSVAGQAGVSAFLAPFFIRSHGLPLQQAGLLAGLVLGLGGLIGIPGGGLLADLLDRKSARRALPVMALGLVLATVGAAGAAFSPSLVMTLMFLSIYSITSACYYASAFSTCLTVVPVAVRGAVGALLIVLNNLVGYGVGPQLTGLFSDLYTRLGAANGLSPAIATVGALFLVGAALLLAAQAALKRDDALASPNS